MGSNVAMFAIFYGFSFTTHPGAISYATIIAAVALNGYVIFCARIKRLHDLNASGWVVTILFVP